MRIDVPAYNIGGFIQRGSGPRGLRVGEVGSRYGIDFGGAHQVANRTDSPIRVLMLSTVGKPDIVEYLDTGKIGARSVAGERILLSRPGPMLDYWDGED